MDPLTTTQDLVETTTEDNNQLLTTDEEILLSILPSNVWAYTFKKLEKKHPPSSENLSNSSPYFRSLVLSDRVTFLFPQVLGLIGPEFASQTNTEAEGSDLIRSRKVCKNWNKAVDQFIIEDTLEPDFFHTEPVQPSDHAVVNARYQYFGPISPTKLTQFLEHFEQTHLPHLGRNPFIGKVVHIDLTGSRGLEGMDSMADQASTLLRKYGQHIEILNMRAYIDRPGRNMRLENLDWLLECLGNCPNLTHLKVVGQFNSQVQIDVAFGERPDSRRGRHDDMGRFRQEQMLNDLGDIFGNVFNRYRNFMRGALPRPNENNQMNRVATLKNLKCLKLCQLTHLIFNSLISANTHVVWLQIEPRLIEAKNYVNFYALEFPNLKKLSIKCGLLEDARKLRSVHESWLQLTHLDFEYLSSEFMEWREIFGIISEKWGNTLTDLRLKLPLAESEEDKEKIVRDSTQSRLNLPKLKRLKIWLSVRPGEASVAKTDFLDLLRMQLEELVIE